MTIPGTGRGLCSFYTLQGASDKLLTKCVNKYISGREAALGGQRRQSALLQTARRWSPPRHHSFLFLLCWFIYEVQRSGGSHCSYYVCFRFPVQHRWCLSRTCQIAQRYSVPKPFSLLSVDAGFSHRPALVVVTLFRVFSEGRHPVPPPPRLHSPTLPPPIPHSLQQLTSRHACVNAPCLERKLFFIRIIMGLLGLEKYPAFVAFKIFFHPDLNMIYQKKMTKRGSLRTSTSASVSIQRTFAHDDAAFRFVAKILTAPLSSNYLSCA